MKLWRAMRPIVLVGFLLALAAGAVQAGEGERAPPGSDSRLAQAKAEVLARSLDLLRVRMEAQLGRAETLRQLGRFEDALAAYEQVDRIYVQGQAHAQVLLARLEASAPGRIVARAPAPPRIRVQLPDPAPTEQVAEVKIGLAAGTVAAGGAFRGRGGQRALGATGGTGRTQTAVDDALKWLAAHQSPNGGWEAAGFLKWCDGKPAPRGPDGEGKALYDPGITGLALCAFLGAGYTNRGRHPFAKTVSKGLRYLKNIQDPEGCFGPRTSQHYVYNHAVAALAMVEAYGMTGSPIFKGSAQQALDFIALSRNPYFVWRYGVKPGDNDTSVTGWMMMALKSAKLINENAKREGKPEPLVIDEAAFDGVKAWLEKMTDPDYGRVGYIQRGGSPARPQELIDRFPGDKSESMTAVGILGRVFIGEDPRRSKVIKLGADLMRKLPPKWNPSDGSIDMYYWYYGTLAMFQVGGASWKHWNQAIQDQIVPNQRKDTTYCLYKGSWDPIGPWGPDGGRVYATALMAMCLEVYYRYERVFGVRGR